jgi:hypothetical protein
MTSMAKAIFEIDFNSNFVAYVSLGSDEYLDIHKQDGSYFATISPEDAERFVDTYSAYSA